MKCLSGGTSSVELQNGGRLPFALGDATVAVCQLRCVVKRHLRPPPDFVDCASGGSNERVSTAHSVGQASVATTTAIATTTVSAAASGVRAATITATVARAEVASNIVA
jgi:hypothetical protein